MTLTKRRVVRTEPPMSQPLAVGFDPGGPPIPPDRAKTAWVDAGALSIGIEGRVLDDAAVAAHLANVGDGGVAPASFDDQGGSIHVTSARTGEEFLRFDLFDREPHYHYIGPGSSHRVVAFDAVAFGDMGEWVTFWLSDRLVPMLRQAGAADLAEEVDPDDVARALPAVIELVTRCGSTAGDAVP
jgi:hypothetical protein